MRTPLSLLAAAVVAAACVPRSRFVPVEPERYRAAGDTVRYGHFVVAVDPAGWQLRLDVRERAALAVFVLDTEWRVRLLDWRNLEPGLQTIPVRRASDFYGRGAASDVRGPRTASLRLGYDAILLVVSDEAGIRGGFQSGDVNIGTMNPDYALNTFPLQILRRANAAWASYLILP